MYKSILLAADGSDNSYRAAKEVLNLCSDNTTVTILTVESIDESVDNVLHSVEGQGAGDKRKKKLQKITELFDSNNIRYTVRIEKGEPKEKVVESANSGQYEIVVLGTRGLNGLQEMVLGSVSHKVAKRSEIPVLIVK
ncbi:universal stress protein [Macrococcus canis]|uniref:Universal stress protein n=1 Tax=Macrococcoides goetzii TaxID=1891097 RepID=A0A2G5NNS3_9STAP|nr:MULTISPECIES: universal stress protein [Macrococcus]MCO4097211.1 universal stress protein [Macrococcus canis]RAI82121.1 universal stress protein [Macrococcus goetzii]